MRARSQSEVDVFLRLVRGLNDETRTRHLTSNETDRIDAIHHGHSQIEKANCRECSHEAFYGLMPLPHLVLITFTQYGLKSGWEIVATPLTYRVVAFLKRAEQEDYYDIDTNFTPFSLRT